MPLLKRPRKPSLAEIIHRRVENDPITLADRATAKARWGEDWKPKKKYQKQKL